MEICAWSSSLSFIKTEIFVRNSFIYFLAFKVPIVSSPAKLLNSISLRLAFYPKSPINLWISFFITVNSYSILSLNYGYKSFNPFNKYSRSSTAFIISYTSLFLLFIIDAYVSNSFLNVSITLHLALAPKASKLLTIYFSNKGYTFFGEMWSVAILQPKTCSNITKSCLS